MKTMHLGGRSTRVGRWARWGLLPLLLLGLSVTEACAPPEPFRRNDGPQQVTCHVRRSECVRELLNADGVPRCAAYETVEFFATTCGGFSPVSRCESHYCFMTDDPNGFAGTCEIISGEASVAPTGVCKVQPTPLRQAQVTYIPRSRTCMPDTPENTVCESLPVTNATVTECVDLGSQVLTEGLIPAADRRDRSVQIVSVLANAASCPVVANSRTSALTYSLGSGSLGTASAPGISTPLSIVSGFAVVGQTCDIDSGCAVTSLDQFRANVANLSVAGAALTNVVVTNRFAAPLTRIRDLEGPGIAAGALRMQVSGMLNGTPGFFNVENDTPFAVGATSTAFSLTGTMRLLVADAVGRHLPITIGANITATRATPSAVGCAELSSRQRLFGFEDPLNWSAPQATASLVTSPITQGCGALGLDGQGYFTVTGAPFSTADLQVTPAMSVDLFMPNGQPNPYWLGALQMYLTCPSANVFNAYIGQVELTGKPVNRFSTLRFPLPAAVADTLRRPLDDCAFSLALNVNRTGRTWILDNLRFTP